MRSLRLLSMVAVLGGGAILALVLTRRPRLDRDWAPDHSRLPAIEIRDSVVRIEGLRRFRYPQSGPTRMVWDTASYDLRDLSSVWFVLALFSEQWRAPAHTFVSFGFDDSTFVAISVEARREMDEAYGIARGLARNYELIYVIGDETDLIGRRVAADEGDLYVYPVQTTPDKARALLIDMLNRAERLRSVPEFYNTVVNSCNSNLVTHVNRVAPGRIPGGIRLLLPGYADEVAQALGLIDDTANLETVRRRYRINDRARQLVVAPDFSQRIRR